MAAGWRYIAQRLTGLDAGGDFLDFEVPLQGVSVENVLSGHNSLDATITPEYARMLAPDGLPLLKPWRTAIWAEHQGEIRGGGIVVGSDWNGPAWGINCVGLTGYLKDLPYTDAWYGVEVDPLDVVRHIWEHVQSKPGGNLGLEVSDLKTGLQIGVELEQGEFDTESGPVAFESGPVKLAWYQNHDLAADVEKLSSETPFDWVETHRWDGNRIRHKLDFGYPRLGRRRNDLRFVYGENIHIPPAVSNDGSLYATEALVLGAGEGRTMLRGTASRPPGDGLRRVAVVSRPDLRSLASVSSEARRELALRSDLNDVTEFLVTGSPSAPIGSVALGDEVYLQGDTGWVTLDTWARVVSIGLDPDASNTMRLSVIRSNRIAA